MGRLLAPLAAAILAIPAAAQAREFTATDIKTIEDVNQSINRRVYHTRDEPHGPCTHYATDKAIRLWELGFGPGEVFLAIVSDAKRPGVHEVAEVKGTLKGHKFTIVLDNLHSWTLSREDAEREGYVWQVEFGEANPNG